MIRSVIVLLWLPLLLRGMSFDEIPEVTRDYQLSTDPKQCITVCLVSSVTQANLLWINGSVLYSSLMITELNTKLYLVVDYQDKNNYSCVVVSGSGVNQTTHLNINKTCQPCRDENLTMSTSEGDSVTLPTNLTQVQYEDNIQWLYLSKKDIIADLHANKSNVQYDGRFKDRLQLDSKTGSLTITNISKVHSGLYTLRITNGPLVECLTKSYNVSVYDPLPEPVITRNSTQCSSSSKCVVICSVNVTGDTLSWYNGSRLNSSISVTDLKRSNFLCLEVEYQDTNTYSCVVNNSFTNKTTILDVNDLCKDYSQRIKHVVIGVTVVLVLAASMIAFLKWRSRRSQEGAIRSQGQGQANAAPAQIAAAVDNTSNTVAPLMGQPSSSQSEETTPLIHIAAN